MSSLCNTGGPRTPEGKAVSARNSTTHGLFARDIVLPSLGEDPEGYRQIEAEWLAQLQPRNLLEQHYVEKIAAASWRLRRLHRWQAQLFEDESLTEDERLDRLDKVLRHETALHRQIDTAVKMLNKAVPQLAKSRARDQALLDAAQNCQNEPAPPPPPVAGGWRTCETGGLSSDASTVRGWGTSSEPGMEQFHPGHCS